MLLLIAALAAQIVPSGDARYAQPQLAVRGTQVALTFGSAQTVYVAISEDAARTFAAPVAVSSSGELALGMRRGPRVAYSRDALVVSAIVGSEGHGKDGDVVAWRSTDGGKTWSRPVRVNDVAGSAREGLHAMAAGGKNRPASAETRVLGEGAFPVLALLPDGSSLIAWEGKAGLQVLPLPTAAGRTDASTR
jgi:hypothetical protein